MPTEKNEKKVTISQMEEALNRIKENAPGVAAGDDTATDEEFQEMLDRVFGPKEDENAGDEGDESENE